MDNETLELLKLSRQRLALIHEEYAKRNRLIKDVRLEVSDALECLENRETPNIQMAINRLKDIQKVLIKWGD